MSGEREKASEQRKCHPILQWMRNRWGCSLVRFFTLILLLVFSIQPFLYTLTHFNAIDCGSLTVSEQQPPSQVVFPDKRTAIQAMQCFLHAHQRCEAATLAILYEELENSDQVTWSTANGLKNCTLSVRGFMGWCPVLFCNAFPYVDTDCGALRQQEDGLHLARCGTWPDFLVPISHSLTSSPTSPHR